jgi:hypothetical protein
MSTITSLYIPVFPKDFTLFGAECSKENIATFFETTLGLGKVSRVDLASRVSGGGPSIFVHFSEWTSMGETFCQHLEKLENTSTGYKWSGSPIANPNNPKKQPYIVIKINKKPIPTFTIPMEELNVHQLQHAIATMEEELKLKQQKIEEQAKEIAELRNFRDSVIRSFTP